MAKTVVGLFENVDQARLAVHDLLASGFESKDVSLLSKNLHEQGEEGPHADGLTHAAEAVGEGAILGGLAGLLMGLTVLAIPGMGFVNVAGPFAVTLGGGLAGGLVGTLTHHGVPEEEAGLYAESVARGGVLLTVHTSDALTPNAEAIINRFHPLNVEDHVAGNVQKGQARHYPGGNQD